MSLIQTDVERLINEIQSIKKELKQAIDASEVRIQLKIEESQEKLRQLEAENFTLKEKVEKLERRQISNNILIFGLNKERAEITLDSLMHDIKSLLDIDLDLHEIKDIHCLGSQRNCPVKVEFVTKFSKKRIFANCRKLKGTGITIANELTFQQRQEQLVLRRHLNSHKENKEVKTYIRGNKLIIDQQEFSVEQLLEIEEIKPQERKTNSVPVTPTQPPLREYPEEETVLGPQDKILSTPINSTLKKTTELGIDTKQAKKVPSQNIIKVRTRSNNEKKK